MTVRYDLGDLPPAARLGIAKQLDSLGILYNLHNNVLTVADHEENRVDDVISRQEQIEKFFEQTEAEARAEASGDLTRPCELCGGRPAAMLSIRRQVGLVLVMRTYSADAMVCGKCGDEIYRTFQKQTAVKGWTGVRSALFNPVIIATNANNIRKHREEISRLTQKGRS